MPDNVDDLHLTRTEKRTLANRLDELADWILDELNDLATRQTTPAAGPRVTTSHTETPLPFNEAAAETLWSVTNTITAWRIAVARERKYPLPSTPVDPRRASRWLANHIAAIAMLNDAQACADELHDAHRAARRAIDPPPRPDYVGGCETCRGDLWATPPAPHITCRQCGTIIDRATLDHKIDTELRARLFTARELVAVVADRLGQTITPKTIHNLGRRITSRGTNRRGEHLYLCGDILDALTTNTRKPRIKSLTK